MVELRIVGVKSRRCPLRLDRDDERLLSAASLNVS
jgi:hypothetical protein